MRAQLLVVLTVATALLNLCNAWLAVTFLFVFRKHRPFPAAEPTMRFAVIVPARNEAHVLPQLMRSLDRQTYPKDLMDVWVAANNCTDDTVETARALGAKVFVCQGTIRNKGDVLHQVIGELQPMDYDAYVFFDADNIPAPDFLQRTMDAMAAGERVLKASLRAGNVEDGWVAGCYGLYHALMEWTYSRPHTAAGFSSNLVGTGFAVHREVFDRMGGWNTFSMCEDTEFAAQCSRMGVRVAFVPEMISYDEQVSRFGTSLRQRRRWCSGMVESARKMTGAMFSRDCPRKGIARDFGMLFVVSRTAPWALVLTILSLPLQPPTALAVMAGSLALGYVGLTIAAAVLCRIGGYPRKQMRGAIAGFALFTASWAPLQVLALFKPVKTWSPIVHSGQASVAEAPEAAPRP